MGNKQVNYSDEYEEPNMRMEEKHFWPYNNPTRLRKNPAVPPCKTPQECGSLEQFYEFKNWMAKEWAVYTQEILLVQEDMDQCFKNNHVKDTTRTCGLVTNHYLSLVSDKNLVRAKEELWKGRRLVDDKGWVYKYSETKAGIEDALKESYDHAMDIKNGKLEAELAKKKRFSHL